MTCMVTSDAICPTGNPATGTFVPSVNPVLAVSVAVDASIDTVCAGTSVTYTAIPTNGGTAPTYEWRVNGDTIAGTGSTFAYNPNIGDEVVCKVTSNALCTTNNPATGTYHPVVNPLLPVGVEITANHDTVCAETLVTYTATVTNGGTTPLYAWQVNGGAIVGTENVYTYSPSISDTVTCIVTSDATCATNNPATGEFYPVVNPLLPVSIEITADLDSVCAGTTVTYTAVPTNGGINPAFEWHVNNGATAGTDNTYSYIPEIGDMITCMVTSDAICPTGNPATGTFIPEVHTRFQVSVSIVSDANPVCTGTSVNYTAFPINGGTSPTYQWTVNTIVQAGATNSTFAYVPSNGDLVRVILTSSETICVTGSPATSDPVEMTVNSRLPVGIFIGAGVNAVCAGTSVNFISIIENGGTAPTFQWQVNALDKPGATSSNFNYSPANNDVVTCILTSNDPCVSGNPDTSNQIVMTVNPLLTVSVSIAANANPVCAGTSVTFTATPDNGGTLPAYQWKLNTLDVAGATNAAHSFVPVNGDVVTCVLTSDAECATGNPAVSNAVTMTVNSPSPVSVTIEGDANPVCQGTTVHFVAHPINGGPSPSFQWNVNSIAISGATNSTFSLVPSNNDYVVCVVTSNLTCSSGSPASSNTITMTVNPLLPVSVFLGVSANPVCAGTAVQFYAIPVNEGTHPAYKWIVNTMEVPGSTNATFTYAPFNDDMVSCVLTSDALCTTGNPDTSNTIAMMVNPNAPVGITIAADANPVCTGSTVNFTSSVTNEGSAPVYQWKLNTSDVAGATNSTFSIIPANNDVITCVLTSDVNCATGNPATSNAVTMNVNPILEVSVSIEASANPVCSGIPVNYTAFPVNGGTLPAYQWQLNSVDVPGATESAWTYSPVQNDAIKCVMTSNALCATGNPAASNIVTMAINPRPVPVISGMQSVCAGSTSLIYSTATGMSNYSWSVSSGGSIVTTSQSNVIVNWNTSGNQWVSVNYTNVNGCTAVVPTQYNVTVIPIPVPTLTGDITSCVGATGVVYTTESGKNNYSWTISPGGTKTSGGSSSSNMVTVTWNTAGAQWVKVSYRNLTCPAVSPTNLDVTVNTPVTVGVFIGASANPVAAGTEVTYTAIPVNEGTSPMYQWKVNGSEVVGATNSIYSYVPINNDQVVCIMTSSASCVTGNPATSNPIVMIVNGITNNLTVQNVTVSNGQSECYNALDTITVAGGVTIFIVETGGSATFIAGKSIFYNPGTRVDNGGHMLGKIAPSGPFCGDGMPLVAANPTGQEETTINPIAETFFSIYPNPTSGNFTLIQTGSKQYGNIQVEICSMRGERIMKEIMIGEKRHEFIMADVPTGLYFVKIIADDYTETIKVMKTK